MMRPSGDGLRDFWRKKNKATFLERGLAGSLRVASLLPGDSRSAITGQHVRGFFQFGFLVVDKLEGVPANPNQIVVP